MLPKKGKTKKIKESILGPAKNSGVKKRVRKGKMERPDITNTVYQ